MLYASEMRGSIRERRIDYTPEAAVELGATHGYSLRGWGLVGLHFSMLRGDVLKYSNTSHNSATRAREWEEIYPEDGAAAAWDWAAVKRISGRLVRFIRKSAASKRGAISVLPSAHEAQSAGRVKFNVEAEKTARGSRI